MDLSDNKKCDLIKLIEDNKPVPEQYKFRLFEKNSEIELLWNGKSNEVTNVNLPFQIIKNVDEPRKNIGPELQGNLFDDRGRKKSGWTKKNKLALKISNKSLRENSLKIIKIASTKNIESEYYKKIRAIK
jgi:hypothetical protein